MNRRLKKQLPALLGLSSILIACIFGLGYMGWQSMGEITADKYGCFEGIPARQTVVLIDASEPRWDKTQQRALYTYFKQLYNRLDFNEKLSIFTTEGDQVSSVPSARFHVCGQAKTPNELTAIGAAEAQVGYLKRQKQRLFEKRLKPELDAMLSLSPKTSRRQLYESPIMEFIRAVSRTRTLKNSDSMIVISDAIQNSESLRFCRVKNDMPNFKKIKQRRIYRERLKPASFSGVAVEFLMLMRSGYGQQGLKYCNSEEELRSVWRDYLIDNGAASPKFIRIRGGI